MTASGPRGLLRDRYAVLAGAGISYLPPSSLPSASAMMRTIIECDRLPLSGTERAELVAATSPAWTRGVSYSHFLRFEQLVEALQLTCDPRLTSVASLLPSSKPNAYHRALASMTTSGHPVLTTNFDTLIEQASHELGAACTPLVSDDDYESYRARHESFPRPLFKLHGSFQRDGADGHGLVTTISEVTNHLADAPMKWDVVSDLLADHDLLVVGYSGSDDFDVMQEIKYAEGARRLLWICHEDREVPVEHAGLEGPSSLLGLPDRKLAWFFNRLFLSFDKQFGRLSRDVEAVRVIRGRTFDLLGLPTERPPDAPSPPPPTAPLLTEIFSNVGTLELLCGRLLDAVGLFHPAAKHYHAAAECLAGAKDPLLTARANAWLGHIYLTRSKNELAEPHLATAWSAYGRSEHVAAADRRLLASFPPRHWRASAAVRLWGSAGSTARGRKLTVSAWRQNVAVAVRRRVLELQYLILDGRTAEVDQVLASCHQWEDTLDAATRASLWYWSACALDLRIREGQAEYDGHDAAWSKLEAAISMFEEEQDYAGWIDALILNAERHLRGPWVDRTYEDAYVAFRLSALLSNDVSATFALALMQQAAERMAWSEDPRATHGVMVRPEKPERLKTAAETVERRIEAWTPTPDTHLGIGQNWIHFPYPDVQS